MTEHQSEPIRHQRRRTLTDKMVAALPRKRKRYTVSDPEQRGLYIRVPPQGPSTFSVVARNLYKQQIWHTIGSADVLKIEEARDKARAAIKRIKAGLPPVEPPPVKPDSFRAVAETWLKRHVAVKKLRSAHEIERCLDKYVLPHPHWADRDFISIRRSDIAALLDHLDDASGPRQADMVLAILRSIANWYATRHDDYVSPFVRGMRRHKAGARERILNDEELRAVWKQAEANGPFGAIVRLLLLTGQRREKVATMKWADVVDGVWTIATVEREKGNAGSLALPPQALEIINAQPRLSGNPYVFAGRRGVGGCLDVSQSKRPFDAKLPSMPRWTLHDLRRTARSLMSRADVRPDIAERVLGHVQPGVKGVYDRHQYLTEKGDALNRLAALIGTIVNPPADNVRQLRRRAAKS
jgi:integrase